MYSRQDIPLRACGNSFSGVRLSLWGIYRCLFLCVSRVLPVLGALFVLGVLPFFGNVFGPEGRFAVAFAADDAPVKIRLFGTLEFRGALKTLPTWLDVLKRNEGHSIFTPGSKLNASTTWDDFKAKAEKLSPLEQLKMVNLFWNKWPYREDKDVYGKADYWAIPEQFRKNSGDCEDYSIAKYFTLRALGVDTDTMRIVVLKETIRNIAHAVLVVYSNGDAYVLDNLSNNVLSHSRYRNYDPQYSVNETARWAHVRPRK